MSFLSQSKKANLRFTALIACFLCSLPALAQLNLGRITGAITDQTGGAIVGATVTVVDVARGVSRPLMTDNAGEYNAPGLTPGTYTVRAEAMGFRTLERQNVPVLVGGEVRVDLTLQPGEQTQTVTVTETLPMLNTTSSTLGGTLETQQIAELPLNGRSFVKMMNWVPGTQTINGNDFNFNGTNNHAQVWMFDGIDEFNPYGTGPIVGGTSGFTEATIMPLDSINEVNIQTNPKAEYGWRPGAVVNTGVKSGTNAMHGTAFAMGRDTALDARNPYLLSTQPKSTDNFEQYGGSLGGPIIKSKVFYFGSYEGQRYTVAVPGNSQRPVALSGLGNKTSIPDAIAGINAVNPALLSQLSVQMTGCNFSNPNITSLVGATVAAACNPASAGPGALPGVGSAGIFFNGTGSKAVPIATPLTGGSDNGIGKIDYHLNDHNSLNGEYFMGEGFSDQENSPISTAENWWLTGKFTRAQLGRVVWVNTPNSNWVNEARFGITREYQTGSPAECTQNLGQPNYLTAYGFVDVPAPPPFCGFPQLTVTGFTILGTNETSGGPSDVHWTDFAGIDSVSYTHGKHQFKFGVEIHNTILNGTTKLNYIHGKLTFGQASAFPGASPLEDFLTGTVGTSSVLVGNNSVPGFSNLSYNRYSLFGQDDWRLTPKLTVNLGLRWEITPAPAPGPNQFGTFNPNSGMVQVGKQISSLYPTDWKQFEPRLGLAYDISGKGTTVIRAGASLIYEWLPINGFMSPKQGAAVNVIPTGWALFDASGNRLPSPGTIVTGNLSPPASALTWAPGQDIFNLNPSLLSCGNGLVPVTIGGLSVTPSPCNIQPINPNFKPGYVSTFTLGVQHAITNNLSLSVAYVGTLGRSLAENVDINQPGPGIANSKKSPEAEQVRQPFYGRFPYLGQIFEFTNGGISNYNGLQVALNSRAYHGVTFSANYTYSHTLGNVDNDYGSYFMHNENPLLDYGSLNYDFRHAFNFTITYAVPGIKSPAQLLQGWELNTVLSVLSATPYNVLDSTDPTGTGIGQDRWTVLGNAANLKSGVVEGSIPCYGVKGSTFDEFPCTTVASVAAMPMQCQTAASTEPTGLRDSTLPIGATLPVTEGGGLNTVTTGLQTLASVGCYFENGTAMVPPAQGTFGTMSRNGLRTGLPFREWDASVTKSWKFKERLTAQFRVEIYNIINHPIYDLPNTDPSDPTTFGVTTDLNNSGDPVLGTGGPRQIDLMLKLVF